MIFSFCFVVGCFRFVVYRDSVVKLEMSALVLYRLSVVSHEVYHCHIAFVKHYKRVFHSNIVCSKVYSHNSASALAVQELRDTVAERVAYRNVLAAVYCDIRAVSPQNSVEQYGEEVVATYRVCLFGRAASLDNGSVLQASGERTALSSEKILIRVTAG